MPNHHGRIQRHSGRYNTARGRSDRRVTRPTISRDVKWGEIVSPGAAGRRIHVTNIPHNLRIKDIKDFFGESDIEGIRLTNYFAHVQFHTPALHLKALQRDGEMIFQKRIKITRFEEKPTLIGRSRDRTRSESPSELSRRLEESRRHRDPNYMEGENKRKSRSNSVSSSDEPPVARTSNNDRITNTNRVDSAPSNNTSSISKQILDDVIVNYNSAENTQNRQNFITRNELMLPSSSNTTGISGSLPRLVELTLRMILENQSARHLSETQIDNVIEFLKMERNYINQAQSNFGIRNQPETNLFLRVPQATMFPIPPSQPSEQVPQQQPFQQFNQSNFFQHQQQSAQFQLSSQSQQLTSSPQLPDKEPEYQIRSKASNDNTTPPERDISPPETSALPDDLFKLASNLNYSPTDFD